MRKKFHKWNFYLISVDIKSQQRFISSIVGHQKEGRRGTNYYEIEQRKKEEKN